MGTTFAAGCCAGSGGGGGDVTSVFSRTGAVLALAGDYTTALITRAASPTLAGTTCETALVEVSTSIYAKTVWVAQGHAKATDVRVGLSDYDMLHPFETLTAAMAAIVLSGATEVCVRVASGFYDEAVVVPAGVWIFGEGEDVFLVRTEFLSGGSNGIQNVAFYNDAAVVVSAPNQSPIYTDSGTILRIKDVRANDYFATSLSAQPTALDVRGSFAQIDTSQFAAYQITGGVGVDGPIWSGARNRGSSVSTITANASLFIGSTNVQKEDACAILHTNTDTQSAVSTLGCSFNADISNVAADGRIAAFLSDSAAGKIVSQGDQCFLSSNPASTPQIQCAAYVLTTVTTTNVIITNMTIHQTGSAANFGGGLSVGAGSTLRMLAMVWPTAAVEPPRIGALTGTYVHEGVLQTGVRFPASGGSVNMTSGNTLWVDVNAPTATDVRGLLSPFDQANPWASISAAVAAANPGVDVVRVRAGQYTPTATIVIPAFQQVVGEEGAQVNNGTGLFDIFAVTDGSILEGFRIATPSASPQSAVICNGTGTNPIALKNLSILGSGGGIGVYAFTAAQSVYCENVYLRSGTVDVMFAVETSGSITLVNSGTILDSDCVAFAALTAGGAINIQGVQVFGTATNGFRIASGSVVFGNDLYYLGGSTAVFWIIDPGCAVNVENVNLQSSTYDVLIVDPADVTSNVVLQGFWDLSRVSAPLAWFAANKIRGSMIGITENVTIGRTGIGNLLSTSPIGFSGGLPSTVGMAVLRNTSLDVGVWSDITALLIAGTATDLFSATASGATVYFGSDVPIWAVALNLTQALAGPGVQLNAEYWDGAAWANISAMETDRSAPNATTPPKRRGRSWLTTLGGLYFRWGSPAAALLTLDGIDKYWLRLRTSGGAIVVQPRANQALLVPSGEQRDAFGYIQYFGSASPNCDIMERKFKDLDITSASNPAAVTLTIGDMPYSLTVDDAGFANAATNRTTEITHLPGEIDTSRLAKLQLFWYRAAGTAGLNVLWEWSIQTKNNGELYTTVGATTIQSARTVPAVVNTIEVLEFDFDFLNQIVAADTLLAWYLTRLGTDLLDTFDNSVFVLLIAANGYKWRP